MTMGPLGDLGRCAATFHFEGKVEGVVYPSLSPAQQDQLVADFCKNRQPPLVVRGRALAAGCMSGAAGPRIGRIPDLEALIPAAIGQRGRIELPAWKVVAGEAVIAHELAHVFFPNGNPSWLKGSRSTCKRGSAAIRPSPTSAGRCTPMAVEVLRKMVPDFAAGDAGGLAPCISARSTG